MEARQQAAIEKVLPHVKRMDKGNGGPSHTRASCFLCVAVRRQHAVISLEHWERSGQGVLCALWYLIIEPFRITGTCS
jgi:hypothetical protein